VFFARRLIYAVITVFAGSLDGGLTVALVVAEMFMFSYYLAAVQPQDTRTGNRVELASEVLLTYCFFGMMVCLYTIEPKQQYTVGWLSVSSIIILVIVCVCYLASDSVSVLLQWLKKKIVMRRRHLEI
jgi:peptidoglycan/LPS O-acetylase OafA/YrhL